MEKSTHSIIKRIAFIGNYLPRQCGIATFTTDLCESLADEYKGTACFALPVNDTEAGYEYPPRVRFELAEKDIESYRRAADFLNINNVDMVSLQHEYGIFGGRAGSYILTLLRELRMPVVTTLHTILQNPNPDQRRVLEEIVSLSDRVVVMSERGAEFLQSIYHVPEEKIDLIPHGIRGPKLSQGSVWRGRQKRFAEFWPAVREQRHRERHFGTAHDFGEISKCGVYGCWRNPPTCCTE